MKIGKTTKKLHPEQQRLEASHKRTANWQRWGPYLSERQWGTVREDYSPDGEAWTYFPHDHAAARAYRWGEDGLLGFTDRECRLCFSLALWNGKDPILKERLFGLSGPEGNHGEDVKELYYYLDSTPTHSYVKSLYKYPQSEFPYQWLKEENSKRGLEDGEFEILDTGIFNENKYWDIFAEYAKAGPNDILIKITVANRGPDTVDLHVLPQLWFRNFWSWGELDQEDNTVPTISQHGENGLITEHPNLEPFHLWAEDADAFLFTENETNLKRIYNGGDTPPYAKDAFHRYLIDDHKDVIKPTPSGSKAAAHYPITLAPGASKEIRLRLSQQKGAPSKPFSSEFDKTFKQRIKEADSFYAQLNKAKENPEEEKILRQAYAGMLNSKQFYHYSVRDWLKGDLNEPPPPESRNKGRNHDWSHLYNRDIISMPDKWEYPWFAAWDLAFHMIPFDKIDPEFSKAQLILFLREWYMHPNGQIPAYEWNFSDVNPPVHAWSVWRVYKMTGKRGERDFDFLSQCFHKLLLNFTWWVNRKDPQGNNLFAGGFLGLDNIGAFDRSKPLPCGINLEQADGTAWMAFFSATMLSIALELASHDPAYEGVASKFLEHFVSICEAVNTLGGSGLWDHEDGFYYDTLHNEEHNTPIKIRSMVGILSICAVEVLSLDAIDKLPRFKSRMQWFIKHKHIFKQQASSLVFSDDKESEGKLLLALPSRHRLERVLKYVFAENEFLSPHGIRSLSKFHEEHPFQFSYDGERHTVSYVPAESDSYLFGGNSNWRGPIWFPVNFLLIEALEKYHHFYGDRLRVEYPTGSGKKLNLKEIALDISQRLVSIFKPDKDGNRPVHKDHQERYQDPHFKDLLLFYEYFHGDSGRGVGASHQTGWTGLVAKLLEDGCQERSS